MNTIRLVAAGAAISVLLVSLSGCGESSDPQKMKLVNVDGIQKEYREATEKLTFPQGVTPPAEMETSPEIKLYQAGWGETVAQQYWLCYWEKEWLETYNTDQIRAAAAFKNLEETKEMNFIKNMDPSVSLVYQKKFGFSLIG